MSGADPSDPSQQGGSDPWAAFGYLVAGVAIYGLLGWGLGRWLNAPYLTPLGIVVGMAFGLYLVFHEYFRSVSGDAPPPTGPPDRTDTPQSTDASNGTDRTSNSTERTAEIEGDATRPDDED